MKSTDPMEFSAENAIIDGFAMISEMPRGNLIGILAGVFTFCITICIVLCLVVRSGTLERLAAELQEDRKRGGGVRSAVTLTMSRPLLLQELSDSRGQMLSPVKLTLGDKLRLSLPSVRETSLYERFYKLGYDGYLANGNNPDAAKVPGVPSCAVEAYARGYASCCCVYKTPSDLLVAYCGRYSRVYAAVCCRSNKECEAYEALYDEHPEYLVGANVYLVPSRTGPSSLVKEFEHATDGSPFDSSSSYPAGDVWGFKQHKPKVTISDGTLWITDGVTRKVFGCVLFGNDNPEHLSVELVMVVVHPSYEGTLHHLEAIYMALDRIFALGYRRVSFSCDEADGASRKFVAKLGFVEEGVLRRNFLVEMGTNGDVVSGNSRVFSIVNAEWNNMREKLYSKIYGEAAKVRERRELAKDTERTMQQEGLEKQKKQKAA